LINITKEQSPIIKPLIFERTENNVWKNYR
jgi:hypothetical protein